MCSNIKRRTLNGTFCLKSLFRINEDREIMAFTFLENKFVNVTVGDWGDPFKDALTSCGGAVVLITKTEDCDELTTALNTYKDWYPSEIHNLYMCLMLL